MPALIVDSKLHDSKKRVTADERRPTSVTAAAFYDFRSSANTPPSTQTAILASARAPAKPRRVLGEEAKHRDRLNAAHVAALSLERERHAPDRPAHAPSPPHPPTRIALNRETRWFSKCVSNTFRISEQPCSRCFCRLKGMRECTERKPHRVG
jgi:hypothetical protein